MSELYDISPPIGADLAVWPGDTKPSREVLADLNEGDNLTLSTLHATVHLGAHADAPSHFDAAAPTIDLVQLEPYLGPCQVFRVDVGHGRTITPAHLDAAVEAERVLLATNTFPDPGNFNTDFAAPGVELIDHLADAGVLLIGVDTPSVDHFDSTDLPVHHRLIDRDMRNLEGLVLAAVPPGIYELIALPLPLVGFDASPVRAVIRARTSR